MTASPVERPGRPGHDPEPFFHHALLYRGDDELLAGTIPFLQEGLDGGESVLVAVPAARAELLRDGLGRDADVVRFVDMEQVGRNPARIIPVWREHATRAAADDVGARGIGEPVWPGRTPEEIVECQHHERLLHAAIHDVALNLLCPYHARHLPADVVAEAHRCHHTVVEHGVPTPSATFEPPEDHPPSVLDLPLPPPPGRLTEHAITPETLPGIRRFVADHAFDAGLDRTVADDAVLSVFELAANTIRHAGGQGLLRSWADDDGVVHEVVDDGWIRDPLVGRIVPPTDQTGGRGLWMVNQMCDLVQMRSSPAGTLVRIHLHRRGQA
jgi:anti-sigma regulatory factor (Ser/Thr protein kinase)